jgi:hypothetical protein
MQLTDILNEVGGLQAIARELGISEADAAAGAAALAPAMFGGLKRQAQAQPGGLEDLLGMLGRLGGDSLLEQVLAPAPTSLAPGNDVLGQVFGSREVSRTVAQHAATRSGLDPALLKKMLPILAMLVGGYMSRQAARAPAPRMAPAHPGLAPSQGGGLGGLGSLLDLNGDGNPLDDILSMAGKLMR